MKRGLLVLSVIGLMCVGGASAAVRQGDTELEFLGGFLSEDADKDGTDFDSWFVSGSLGYFLSDTLQVGVSALGAQAEMETFPKTYRWLPDADSSTTLEFDTDIEVYGVGARVKHHFMPTNQWVPYVGLQVFWACADVDVSVKAVDPDAPEEYTKAARSDKFDGVLWGPVAGLRFELSTYNDFFVEYQYHRWDGGLREVFDEGHAIYIGIVHQFK